jgi:branched-chain amino acid transport system permease protein
MRTGLATALPYLAIVVLTWAIVIADRPFWIQLMIGIFITAVLALAWDMLSRTGQVSLGMAAFFGIGTYTVALVDPIAGTAVAWIAVVLVCAVAAVLLGLLTLRLRHMYFAIATLGFSLSLQVLVTAFPDITGGSGGVAPPLLAGGEPRWQLVAIAGLLLLATATSDLLLTRRFRPAFFMIRSKPELAAASGVPVVRTKIMAFILSGIYAGLAGACYGGLYGYVVPGDVFTSNWSIMPLAIAILGGMDTTAGPLLGAIVLRALEELARVWIGGIGYQVVYGAVIIAFVLALPRGLMGFIGKFAGRGAKDDVALRLREGGVKS